MKFLVIPAILTLSIMAAQGATWKENERGIVGYDDTEILPWCGYRKHDSNRPVPSYVVAEPVVLPAPGDAVVLFDGGSLAAFRANAWTIRDGVLVAGEGDLESVEAFGDCQIHLEFRVPERPSSEFGNRGNSGVFPMSYYEIQIFDSHPIHQVQLYPDGQCAAIYGETPPRVNACRKPGEWQSFDIVFTAPRFNAAHLVSPARVTMLHNGVLVHLNEEVHGRTGHREITPYSPHAEKLPFKLQGHGSAVEFRNVWIRPLEGGESAG